MRTFRIKNLLLPKMYLKAMLWSNAFLFAVCACYMLLKKGVSSPLLASGLSIAILICYLWVIQTSKGESSNKKRGLVVGISIVCGGIDFCSYKRKCCCFYTFLGFPLWERSRFFEIQCFKEGSVRSRKEWLRNEPI